MSYGYEGSGQRDVPELPDMNDMSDRELESLLRTLKASHASCLEMAEQVDLELFRRGQRNA